MRSYFPQFLEAPQLGTHMAFVAKKIFLTKGVGKHRERLSSFELALRNAGIAACNIVRVSSIFPPYCKLISRSEGLKHLKPGQVAFTVISENQTREPHRLIAAGVGLALPADKSMYGYLSEHHSFGESEEIAGEYTEELAAEMLATTLNVEFDPDLSWDEKKRGLSDFEQNRPHHEYHPVSRGRQARTVDHGARRCDPSRRGRLSSPYHEAQTHQGAIPSKLPAAGPCSIRRVGALFFCHSWPSQVTSKELVPQATGEPGTSQGRTNRP